MILMMIIPIILTVFPVMLYQVVLLLCKRKSTSTHYFWTYTMMIYVWLVFSVTGIGSVWDIISKGGLIETFQQANIGIMCYFSDLDELHRYRNDIIHYSWCKNISKY